MSNIYQKMLAIMEDVSYIQKDKENKHFKYNYASEYAIKKALHEALIKNRVHFQISFSDQRVSEYELEKTDSRGKTYKTITYKTCVSALYRFTDVDDLSFIEGTFEGQGEDVGDKGLYKAFTGCIKYCLTSNFLIPTGDDPEVDSDSDDTKVRHQLEIIDENKLAKTDFYAQIKDMQKLGEVTKWWNSLNKSEKKYAVSAKDRKKRELLDIDTKIKNIKSNTTEKILTDIESDIDKITDGAEKESAITAYNNKLEKVGIDHKYEPLPFG